MSGSGIIISNGYNKLNWYNVAVLDGLAWPNTSGFYTGVTSGAFVSYNGGGNPMSILSVNTSSVFSILSFVSCAFNLNGLVVQMTGSRSGIQLYSATTTLAVLSRSFVYLNWTNIDTFNMSAVSTNWFTMDNLSVCT